MRRAYALLMPLLLACSAGESLFGEGERTQTQTTGTGGRGGEGGRSATSSSKSSSDSTAMDASSSTGEDICAPNDEDSPCTKCAKLNCCPQLEQCDNDENCSCWVECYNDDKGFFECQSRCGPQGATFAMLEGCVGGPCFLDCS